MYLVEEGSDVSELYLLALQEHLAVSQLLVLLVFIEGRILDDKAVSSFSFPP